MERALKRYMVYTPPYDDGYYWDEPPEYGSDVYEVEAENKWDALSLAVKYWLSCGGRNGQWVRDRRSDGLSPYSSEIIVEDLSTYADDVTVA